MRVRSPEVVATVPDAWAERLVEAGGARPGSPHPGWGPVLHVGKGDCLVTVDVLASCFRQLTAEALSTGDCTLMAAGPEGWRVVKVAGLDADQVIEAVARQLGLNREECHG